MGCLAFCRLCSAADLCHSSLAVLLRDGGNEVLGREREKQQEHSASGPLVSQDLCFVGLTCCQNSCPGLLGTTSLVEFPPVDKTVLGQAYARGFLAIRTQLIKLLL